MVRGVAYWGTVTVAALLLILWIVSGPVIGIGTVTVEGYTGPQKAAVQETAELVAATGSMVRVPVGNMRRALERFPGVVDVRVERDWPRSITVDVTMGEPVAILAVESGGRYLLSPSGQIMGKAGTTVGLPVISVASPPPGGVLSAPGDRAALLFVGWLQPEVAGRLRNLRFEDGRLFADLANGLELRIGPPTKLAQKAQALAAVLAQADPKAVGDAAYLDISNPSRPMLGAKVVPLPEEGSDEESPAPTDTTGGDADGTDGGDGSGDTGTTDDGTG
ncbi:MAG: FtsQ-type POTRA domain-containing protein [Thermoleophilia bacterium]